MIRVDGPSLAAVINPDRGGKITSLRDVSGTEWLTQGVNPSPGGSSFVDAEMAGWDECAPTIVACRVDGREIPDHGDLWNDAFTIDEDGSTLTGTGASLGYRFQRGVTPTDHGLRLDYSAIALHRPIPFLWAAHPQFAAPPGSRVEIQSDLVIDVLDPGLATRSWTHELASIDTVAEGKSRKVYVHPDRPVASARLVRPNGDALEMRWSKVSRYLGLWFDNRAFSREQVVAIEPSTAFFDSLAVAVKLGRAPILDPQRPLHWWIDLRFIPSK